MTVFSKQNIVLKHNEMADIIKKAPLIQATICRCCGSIKKCRLLDHQYTFESEPEVYSEMIFDCFGLVLSNMENEGHEKGVCATCVVRLRDSVQFKRQILKCEEILLQKLHYNEDPDAKVIKDELSSDDDQNRDECYYPGDIEMKTDSKPTSKNEKKTKIADDEKSISIELSKSSNSECDRIKVLKRHRVTKRRRMQEALLRNISKTQKLINKPKINVKEKRVLQEKLKPPDPSVVLETLPKIYEIDEERKTRHNIEIIVENSYVCPFRNRISNYYCYYCKNIFTDVIELRSHVATHNPKRFELTFEPKRIPRIDITRIDCRLCNEKITDLKTFKQHIQLKHKKTIYQTRNRECIPFILSNDNINCLECDQTFQFIDKLIEHLVVHYGEFVCDLCGTCFIEEATLLQHLRSHKKVTENYPCEVCGKNLKSNYSRSLHIATIHEKKPFVHCYKCNESFLSYAQRNRHLINVHGDNRKFLCKYCCKNFDVRKSMVEHVRKNHLQVVGRYQCDVCDQRFHVPSHLKEHKASHTGEKLYKCDVCEKAYPRRQSLLEHIRSHSRKMQCNLCESSFSQADELQQHLGAQHQVYEGFLRTDGVGNLA